MTTLPLVAGLLPPLQGAAAARPAAQVKAVPSAPLPRRAAPSPKMPMAPKPAPPRWPRAGSAVVDLTAGSARQAGSLPIQVSAPASGAKPARVRVESLGADVAKKMGGHGLAVRLRRADGSPAKGRVRLTLDYSGFRHAFGGDFATRLRLTAFPACVVERPADPACAKGTPVQARNDLAKGQLVAEVDVAGDVPASTPSPSAGTATPAPKATPAAKAAGTKAAPAEGATVYAVTSGTSGTAGNYEATPLSPSSEWSVSGGSGNFTWSYPIPMPPNPYGKAPELALTYSSASVDGKTLATNSQASWVGMGWELTPPYIERRYQKCYYDDEGAVDPGPAYDNDLCWGMDNAYLSFGSVSGELIRDGGTNFWRLRNDPGWKVEHRTGAPNDDSNGEYWILYAPDGTQYYFGWGVPAAHWTNTKRTNSVWKVFVFGDDPGEPCHAGDVLAYNHCHQGWRWNLDLVIDRNNNFTTYTYGQETSYYRVNGSPDQLAEYHRGGWLSQIDYGFRGGEDRDDSAVRVSFTTTSRCREILTGGTCPSPSVENAASYPDVPLDLLCYQTSCDENSQVFFTAVRLKSITTKVRNGSGYTDVDRIDLDQQFPDPGDGTDASLWLARIYRTGFQGAISMSPPPVDFNSANATQSGPLPNRVDYDTSLGVPPLKKYRIRKITNELGGTISVSYGQPHPCSASALPDPATNGQDCFPQYFKPEGAPAGWGWFHKYLVTQVEVDGANPASPVQTTTYTYQGTPAWHHDDDPMYEDSHGLESWSQWRGYQKVIATTGNNLSVHTAYYRGMNGDKSGTGGTKSVTVTDLDGNSYPDDPRLEGRPIQDMRKTGPSGAELDGHSRYGYWTSRSSDNGVVAGRDAYLVRTNLERTRAVTKAGSYRQTETQTSYEATFGLPTQVLDLGDTAVTGDERCTTTAYATDTTTGWQAVPYRTELHAGTCAGTVLSRTETYYDNHPGLTDPPTQGNPTKVVSYASATSTVTTTASYDAQGRVTSATDGNGNTTTTTYTPSTGWPTTVTTSRTVGGVAHTTTVRTTPDRGLPYETVDPNGRVTLLEHDPLGRLSEVRLPGTDATEPPDYWFSYAVAWSGSKITAQRLQRMSGTTPIYRYDYTYLDGLGRTIETQADSPSGSGRVVTQTRYDDHGRVAAQTAPMFMSGVAGTGLANPVVSAIPSETRTSYDSLGRVKETALWANGVKKWGTTTSWYADQHTVTPPTGQPTTYYEDVFGQTTSVVETLDAGTATTTYEYDLAGNLTKITDAKGNVTTYTYDWLGRRLTSDDPDAGVTSSEYDANGNVTKTTDARGTVLVSVYDELNRRTQLRKDSVSGPLLAEWKYDPPGNLGALEKSIRYTPDTPDTTDNYTVAHAYESVRGRLASTTWTIPATEGALAGSYTQSFTYDLADRVATTTYAAAGGLASETVTQAYTDLGLPTRLTSPLGTYVDATTFAADGKLAGRVLGTGANAVTRTYTYDPATLRLATLKAVQDTTTIQDDAYAYDAAGNVTRITDQVTGQRQCFTYDGRHRLDHAWTTNVDCTDGANPNRTFGPDPYDLDYAYNEIGNITSVTDKGVTRTYTYPASGATSVRPHAVTAVGSDTYGYDQAGNMTSRTVGGVTTTFAWDETQRLAKAITGGLLTTEFVYDADGNRLIRRTPDGKKTLYAAGMEITDTAGTVTAARYYTTADGATVAVRTTTGVQYLLGDHHGSAQIAVDAATGTVTRRRYTPFGQLRTDDAAFPTDRGFLGKTHDDTTGLVHLDARYYDPALARFLSSDPVLDLRTPQLMNPYTYSGNNPATFSDPSGLRVCEDDCSSSDEGWVDPEGRRHGGSGGSSRCGSDTACTAQGHGGKLPSNDPHNQPSSGRKSHASGGSGSGKKASGSSRSRCGSDTACSAMANGGRYVDPMFYEELGSRGLLSRIFGEDSDMWTAVWGICGEGEAQAGPMGMGGSGCYVVDTQGWGYSESIGADIGLGYGAEGGASFLLSNADDIGQLAGADWEVGISIPLPKSRLLPDSLDIGYSWSTDTDNSRGVRVRSLKIGLSYSAEVQGMPSLPAKAGMSYGWVQRRGSWETIDPPSYPYTDTEPPVVFP